MNNHTAPSLASIRQRAYLLWQQRGCPNGVAESNWAEAQRLLAAELTTPANDTAPKARSAKAVVEAKSDRPAPASAAVSSKKRARN